MRKKINKLVSLLTVSALTITVLLSNTPSSVSADTQDALNIVYNTDCRVLTEQGLAQVTQYGQVASGCQTIKLPGIRMRSGTRITKIGTDDMGFKSWQTKARSAGLDLKSPVTYKELRNLIFNLPSLRQESSAMSAAGVAGGLGSVADYVEQYLTFTGNMTQDDRNVVNRLSKLSVDSEELEVLVSDFDTMKPSKVAGQFAYYGPFSFSANKRVMSDELLISVINAGADVSVVDSTFKTVAKANTLDSYYLKVNNMKRLYNVAMTCEITTPVEHLAFYQSTDVDSTGGYCVVPYVQLTKESANVQLGSFGRLGRIKVTLRDNDTLEPIKGGVFKIVSTDGNITTPNITTDENGTATTQDLPLTKYTINQVSKPQEYLISTNTKNIEIMQDDSTTEVAYFNSRYYVPVKVSVKDKSGKALDAGGVRILNKEGGVVALAQVDKNGIYETYLPYGDYVVEQVSAKPGYSIATPNKQSISVTGEQDRFDITFTNDVTRGNVTVQFCDASTDEALSTGRFEILDANGVRVSVHTMVGQSITVQDLPAGEYKVHQIVAPTDYKINDQYYSFSIINEKNTAFVKLHNSKKLGVITVKAVDEFSLPVLGVKFGLYNSSDIKVAESTTDAFGQLMFHDLAIGEYKIKSLGQPKELDDNTYVAVASILEDGDIVNVDYKYNYIIAKVTIKKTDASNKDTLVKNAVFSVKNSNGIEVTRVSTGEVGEVSFDLKYGNYKVCEVDPGNGYKEITNGARDVVIATKDPVSLVFSSDKVKGAVIIDVHDVNDITKKIKGAVFEMYNLDGTIYSKAVSDNLGIAKFEGVPAGKYYFKQTLTENNYKMFTGQVDLCISTDGQLFKYDVTNVKKVGSITLLYRDNVTKVGIAGATFTLYTSSDDKAVMSVISDAHGYVRFKDLAFGSYYIKMTSPAPGYQLYPDIIGNTDKAGKTLASRILDSVFPATEVRASGKPSITIDENTPDIVIGGDRVESEKPSVSGGEVVDKPNVEVKPETKPGTGSTGIQSNPDFVVEGNKTTPTINVDDKFIKPGTQTNVPVTNVTISNTTSAAANNTVVAGDNDTKGNMSIDTKSDTIVDTNTNADDDFINDNADDDFVDDSGDSDFINDNVDDDFVEVEDNTAGKDDGNNIIEDLGQDEDLDLDNNNTGTSSNGNTQKPQHNKNDKVTGGIVHSDNGKQSDTKGNGYNTKNKLAKTGSTGFGFLQVFLTVVTPASLAGFLLDMRRSIK